MSSEVIEHSPNRSSEMLKMLFVFVMVGVAAACTTLVVGKAATIDGSVLASHSDDGGGRSDPRLVPVPAADYPPNSLRPIFSDPELYPRYVGYDRKIPQYFPRPGQNQSVAIGFIPQVKHTFAYFEATYGIINEKQVAMSESTCSSRITTVGCDYLGQTNCAIMSIDELSRIGMERASTARQAIQIMGDLAVQYGFYGIGTGVEEGAESLIVSDPNEAFVFHVLPSNVNGTSAVWVAQRVPDDSATVVANMFTIREVNFSDEENFMYSKNIRDVALSNGWWLEGAVFDFTAIYSAGEYAHKFYSGRRMWRALSLFAPALKLDPDFENILLKAPYPWAVVPEKKMGPRDLMAIHRDWYGNSSFDMAAGIAAGPFGSPNRYTGGAGEAQVPGSWERPIDLFRTTYIQVTQSRSWLPEEIGAVVYYTQTGAHGTCFVPFMPGFTDSVPAEYWTGWGGEYSRNSSYWAFRSVNTIADLKFKYMISDIQKEQAKWESQGEALVADLTSRYVADPSTVDVVGSLQGFAKDVVRAWWSLADFLVFRYADGYDNVPNAGSSVGYPSWWLREVGYPSGPPPPTHREVLHHM